MCELGANILWVVFWLYFFFSFEIGSYYADYAGLNLCVYCNLCFPNAEITDVYCYAWRELILAHNNSDIWNGIWYRFHWDKDSAQKTVLIILIVWIEWSRCCSVL